MQDLPEPEIPEIVEEFVYKGYFWSEAEEFFNDNVVSDFLNDNVISEERDGCNVVGHFIKLSNNNTHLPSKGDIFVKDNNGRISLIQRYDEI